LSLFTEAICHRLRSASSMTVFLSHAIKSQISTVVGDVMFLLFAGVAFVETQVAL
jgi:hypothetical protein